MGLACASVARCDRTGTIGTGPILEPAGLVVVAPIDPEEAAAVGAQMQ